MIAQIQPLGPKDYAEIAWYDFSDSTLKKIAQIA